MNERILPDFTLSLPENFANYEWEVTAKGWFANAWLNVSGRSYRLTFYDATRLAQEIQNEFDRGLAFFEPNLVVVRSVTKSEMERAAEWLVQSGQSASLFAERVSRDCKDD